MKSAVVYLVVSKCRALVPHSVIPLPEDSQEKSLFFMTGMALPDTAVGSVYGYYESQNWI